MEKPDRIEVIGGKEFKVYVIPEKAANPERSKTTHYRMKDVEKQGSVKKEKEVMNKTTFREGFARAAAEKDRKYGNVVADRLRQDRERRK
jgi:hypothetical protein